MKMKSNFKAVPSDVLSLTAVSLQEVLCAGCQSPHGSQQLLLNLFQNVFPGEFQLPVQKGEMLAFFFQFPGGSVLADELKDFYTLLTAKKGKNPLPLRFA